MKKIFFLTMVIFGVYVHTAVQAQTKSKADKKAAKEQEIKHLIDSGAYTFKANIMNPMGGPQRILTIEYYDIKISPDTIKSFLPYFGRVYMNPPLSSSDAGIMFTSTHFNYKKENKKKGGWLITIEYKDTDRSNKMTLDILPGGTATLVSNSNTRDAIIFYGDIINSKSK